MHLLDSRRLTGPNLVRDAPGALLDVAFSEDHAHVVAYWQREMESLLAQVGLAGTDFAIKPRKHGAWLVVGGPIDQLYGLLDLSEMAWHLAVEEVAEELGISVLEPSVSTLEEGAPPPDLNEIVRRLGEESNPALLAIQQAANKRAVPFLWDDDFVSIGAGLRSRTWPVRAIQSPSEVDWASLGDIPVAVVTGTNGKTTTIRLLAHMAERVGLTCGSTSTDWIKVGGDVLDAGDYSGPGGARTVMRDPRVEMAFLETARGGLLRRGAGVSRANVALITNVAEDHMGQYGIHSVEDLVEAKMIVARLVKVDGTLVLNADDNALVSAASRMGPQKLAWFSLDHENKAFAGHIQQGGSGCAVREGFVTYWSASTSIDLVPVAEIPITLGGRAAYNVSNALAAATVALELGLPVEAVREGLLTFKNTPDSNPGRSNYFQVGGVEVLLDYAHNVHGLAAILATTANLSAKRRILTLSTAGDRTEQEIRHLAAEAARAGVEEILVSDCIGYERELGEGGVPRILMDELLQWGVQGTQTETELDAAKIAFERARDGDLLILLVKAQRNECLELIQEEAKRRSK